MATIDRFIRLVVSCFLFVNAVALGDETVTPKPTPAEQLYPIKVDGRRGYINRQGKIVIEPRFEQGGQFRDGLAWVVLEKRVFYIDTSGKEAFKCAFTGDHSTFSDGFAMGSIGLKFHFIDTKGKLLPGFFAGIEPFSDGMAAVCVNPARFEAPKPGQLMDYVPGKWGFIDSTGKLVIAADYWSVGSFSHGLAPVLVGGEAPGEDTGPVGGKWGYVDTKGEVVIRAQFESAHTFSEGLARLSVGEMGTGYIDVTGKMIIEPRRYDLAGDFHDGVAIVRGDPEFKTPSGHMDKQGKITVPKARIASDEFSEGLAVADTKSTWNGKAWMAGPKGFVDKQGEWVIKPQFKWANPFKDGIASVGNEDSRGYIDKSGKFIWQLTK